MPPGKDFTDVSRIWFLLDLYFTCLALLPPLFALCSLFPEFGHRSQLLLAPQNQRLRFKHPLILSLSDGAVMVDLINLRTLCTGEIAPSMLSFPRLTIIPTVAFIKIPRLSQQTCIH